MDIKVLILHDLKTGAIPVINLKNTIILKYNNEIELSSDILRILKEYQVILIKSDVIIFPHFQDVLNRILKLNYDDADFVYLSSYGNDCNKLRSTYIPDVNICSNPKGLQAVLITKLGRKKLLRETLMANDKYFENKNLVSEIEKNINEGNLKAYCFVPNILNYDITKAEDEKDFLKLNFCTLPEEKDINSSTDYAWLFLIILAVFFVIWIVVHLAM